MIIPHTFQSTWSALTTACRKGNEAIAKALVDAGADVDKTKKVTTITILPSSVCTIELTSTN